MNKKIIFTIFLSLIVFLVFYSCSTSDNKNTLKVSIGQEPGTLDPQYATGSWEFQVIKDMFSGLMGYDGQGKLVPELAERYNISKDNKTYTFYLRDAKWSDGTPITANDFVYSYKRILDPKTASEYASILYIIKGAEAYNTGKATSDSLAVKAISDNVLEIKLEHPANYFADVLVHHAFFPVPQHVVEKFSKSWIKENNIVTSGPYILEKWKSQSYIKVVKNNNYYDASNVKIENIVYYTQSDTDAVFKRYRSGEIDIASFPPEQKAWIKNNIPDQLDSIPELRSSYLVVNVGNSKIEALKNKEIRTALAMAIDRDFIADVLLHKDVTKAYSFVPSAIGGGYKPVQYSWKDKSQEKRVADAKAILAKYGYSENHPLKFELAYITEKTNKTIAIAIADFWKKIGVNASLISNEAVVHYGNLSKQRFDVAFAGWSADYREVSTFLQLGEAGLAFNNAKWNNPEYNKFMAQSRKTIIEVQKNILYQKAEQKMLEDSAYIPLVFPVSYLLVSNKVGGYLKGVYGANSIKYLFIKEEE